MPVDPFTPAAAGLGRMARGRGVRRKGRHTDREGEKGGEHRPQDAHGGPQVMSDGGYAVFHCTWLFGALGQATGFGWGQPGWRAGVVLRAAWQGGRALP